MRVRRARVGRFGVGEHDSRVEDREAVFVGDHRIEIHLGDLRMRPTANPETVSSSDAIASMSTPGWPRTPRRIAAPRSCASIAARLAAANRRQRKRGVLHHLDEHSAEPHHHHRAETLVARTIPAISSTPACAIG